MMRTLAVLLLFAGPAVAADPVADTKAKLFAPNKMDKAAERASLKDVFDFLADRHDLKFTLDSAAFRRTGIEEVGDQTVSVEPKKSQTLAELLKEILDPINATFVVGKDGSLTIVPKRR